jgi:hypothetical protein
LISTLLRLLLLLLLLLLPPEVPARPLATFDGIHIQDKSDRYCTHPACVLPAHPAWILPGNCVVKVIFRAAAAAALLLCPQSQSVANYR